MAALELVIVPVAPLNIPIEVPLPFRSRVPPAIVNAVAVGKAFVVPICKVPEVIVVEPVYVLVWVNDKVEEPAS